MKIYSIIPARSGSKGIPNKNIATVGEHPLLAWSIQSSLQLPIINKTFVSTDSLEYQNIAKKYGAEAPFLRPSEISGDTATDLEFLNHFLSWIKQKNIPFPDIIVFLRPTTPFRKKSVLEENIQKFILEMNTFSSARSGHINPESPHKWYKAGTKTLSPFMELSPLFLEQPRQKTPQAFVPNGYIDLVLPHVVLNEGSVYGKNSMALETEQTIEIDTLFELELAQLYATKHFNKTFHTSTELRHHGIPVKNIIVMINFYKKYFGLETMSHEVESGSFFEHIVALKKGASAEIVKLGSNNKVVIELLCYPASFLVEQEEPLTQPQQKIYSQGNAHAALTVYNADSIFIKLKNDNQRIISEPKISPNGKAKVFFVQDPEYNFIEVVEELKKD
jgi:CMP-N,N'-diacetyllegionaminic acid synthase